MWVSVPSPPGVGAGRLRFHEALGNSQDACLGRWSPSASRGARLGVPGPAPWTPNPPGSAVNAARASPTATPLGSSGAGADASQLGPAATALTSAAETESAAVTGQVCPRHSAKDGADSPHALTLWWQQFRKLEVYFLEITLKTRPH